MIDITPSALVSPEKQRIDPCKFLDKIKHHIEISDYVVQNNSIRVVLPYAGWEEKLTPSMRSELEDKILDMIEEDGYERVHIVTEASAITSRIVVRLFFRTERRTRLRSAASLAGAMMAN